MDKTKVELNRSGVRELMKSAEMQAILLEQANQISSDAEKESYVAQTRAMEKIVEMDDISKCQLNSDYNYTDTTRKKYRYQAVYDMVHF